MKLLYLRKKKLHIQQQQKQIMATNAASVPSLLYCCLFLTLSLCTWGVHGRNVTLLTKNKTKQNKNEHCLIQIETKIITNRIEDFTKSNRHTWCNLHYSFIFSFLMYFFVLFIDEFCKARIPT